MPKGQYERSGADEREARDRLVRQLAYEQGLGQKDIASRVGITDSRVGQILEAGTDRKRILYFLEKNTMGVDSKVIANALGLGIQRVEYVVAAMEKRGLITSDGKKTSSATGDHNTRQNIRLKKRQHGKVQTNGHHQVGITQYAGESGKIVAVHSRKPEQNEKAPEPEQPTMAPFVEERMHPAVREAVSSVALDHDERIGTQSVAPPVGIGVVDLSQEVEAPESLPEEWLPAHDIPRYPLLARLLSRDASIGEAARLLERAGLDDLALQALGHQDQFSDLEREYMKYVRAATRVYVRTKQKESTND